MSVKTRSSTKYSFTKVLAAVALLACINVTFVASVSTGVARSSQTMKASDVLHANTPQQFLRSDTTVTTNVRPDMFQERALAISLPGLEGVATKLKSGLSKLVQKLKLQWWRLRQKSPDDVFTLLKLEKTGDKLFENPVFSQWAAFVTVRNKNDPDMAMFATLAKYYSDDALAKMLTTAKETESTKAIATKMEGLQITNWLNAGDSADDVFKTLKLEQTGGKLFENAVFPNWVAFVAKRNTQDPELAMFSTFARHYSDDALAKMLVAAKEVDSTRSIATKMENLQITNWINADKSSNEVFAILKLDQAGDKLFDSPVLSTWTSFVTKVNKNNPDDVMVTQLAEKFDDVSLAKMILAAAKVERTQSLAADLRSAQFKTWFTAGRTPKYVDTMLKVGANSDDVTKKISRDYEKFYGKVKVTVSESTNKKVDPQGASTSTRIRTR